MSISPIFWGFEDNSATKSDVKIRNNLIEKMKMKISQKLFQSSQLLFRRFKWYYKCFIR